MIPISLKLSELSQTKVQSGENSLIVFSRWATNFVQKGPSNADFNCSYTKDWLYFNFWQQVLNLGKLHKLLPVSFSICVFFLLFLLCDLVSEWCLVSFSVRLLPVSSVHCL